MSVSQKLSEQIPGILNTARVPGLAIALIDDYQVTWEQGFGVKDAETCAPVNTNTIFEAASLTKPLFAYLTLLAVDSHLLELDVPLVTYLNSRTVETELIQHLLTADGFRRDWFGQITARHVLSHSSGMPHGEHIVPFPIYFEPGTRFRYSATGYYFLQLVIEQIKGAPLEKIAEDELFRPLSMEHSSLVWLDRFEVDAADGHDVLGRPHPIRKYQRAHAAASMYTTAGDYARFVVAVLDGDGLSPENRQNMFTPQISIREGESWGLGFGICQDVTGNALWQWGDYGVFHNFVVAYPDRGKAMVYLSNSSNGLGIRDVIQRIETSASLLSWRRRSESP